VLKVSACFLRSLCVGGRLSSFEDFFEAVHGSFSSPSGVVCLLGSVFCLGLACLPWGLPWGLLFGWVGRCALMESLILAQDERWRRA
jgi:hypothetical protein